MHNFDWNFSGSCLAVKTTWSTFGIFKAKRSCSAYKAIQMLYFVQLVIRRRISSHQLHSKWTKQSNFGRATHKLQK